MDGVALGIEEGRRYGSRLLELDPGDTLVFCTDGILEARALTGEVYGVSRLTACLAEVAGGDAQAVSEALRTSTAPGGFLLGTRGEPGRPDQARFVVHGLDAADRRRAEGLARGSGLALLGSWGLGRRAPRVPEAGGVLLQLSPSRSSLDGEGPRQRVPAGWSARAFRRSPDGDLRETPLALLGPRGS